MEVMEVDQEVMEGTRAHPPRSHDSSVNLSPDFSPPNAGQRSQCQGVVSVGLTLVVLSHQSVSLHSSVWRKPILRRRLQDFAKRSQCQDVSTGAGANELLFQVFSANNALHWKNSPGQRG